MHLVILSILPKYCLIHLSYCYFTYKGQCEGFDEKLYLWPVGVAIAPDICKVPTFAWGLPLGKPMSCVLVKTLIQLTCLNRKKTKLPVLTLVIGSLLS